MTPVSNNFHISVLLPVKDQEGPKLYRVEGKKSSAGIKGDDSLYSVAKTIHSNIAQAMQILSEGELAYLEKCFVTHNKRWLVRLFKWCNETLGLQVSSSPYFKFIPKEYLHINRPEAPPVNTQVATSNKPTAAPGNIQTATSNKPTEAPPVSKKETIINKHPLILPPTPFSLGTCSITIPKSSSSQKMNSTRVKDIAILLAKQNLKVDLEKEASEKSVLNYFTNSSETKTETIQHQKACLEKTTSKVTQHNKLIEQMQTQPYSKENSLSVLILKQCIELAKSTISSYNLIIQKTQSPKCIEDKATWEAALEQLENELKDALQSSEISLSESELVALLLKKCLHENANDLFSALYESKFSVSSEVLNLQMEREQLKKDLEKVQLTGLSKHTPEMLILRQNIRHARNEYLRYQNYKMHYSDLAEMEIYKRIAEERLKEWRELETPSVTF